MQTIPLIATYRLQLRNGVDLNRARDLLPWIKELGASHLYLSPPFHAADGSTHGYDVIDPTQIDPVLGGQSAFEELSTAAQASGIGIAVDIVPNHMGFTPENPFLADVLRHGRDSVHAPVFDIDWERMERTRGRIHFPMLDASPATLLADGQIAITGEPDSPALTVYDRQFPLRQTQLSAYLCGVSRTLDDERLQELLAEQHWSLGHWRDDAGDIVHRRFFNITDLIGVRQEDTEVFALTHRWIIDQVSAGRIQGLRVDHIDGLAKPGQYLDQLREAVGNTPIWIEKIVKPGESIPASWPIEGMSGYEFMSPITRLLAQPNGLEAMRLAAKDAVPSSTEQEVRKVRKELLRNVFTPEVTRVTDAAMMALDAPETGRDAVAEAIRQLATVWPVYRSYAADRCRLSELIVDRTSKYAGDQPIHALLDLLRSPDDAMALAFAARFEQLTGALTAKSEEDTVFFRSIGFLPFCEVGSEPDLSPIDLTVFQAEIVKRSAHTPFALNALSTHDTKRSADARAVLLALTFFPDLARSLYAEGIARANAVGIPPRWGIYAVQTALIMRGQDDANERIADHIAKAMREAKDLSTHEDPVVEQEAAVARLSQELLGLLTDGSLMDEDTSHAFEHAVEGVILAQVALQLTAPGIPDIYQGTETVAIALTDPDNRRLVDWDRLTSGSEPFMPLDQRKLALTRELLAERRARPRLFIHGTYRLTPVDAGWRVERELDGEAFSYHIGLTNDAIPAVTPEAKAAKGWLS